MDSAQFQRSKSRLWLTVICASLSLGSAIASTANIPALSKPINPKKTPPPAVVQLIRQTIKQQFGVDKIIVLSAAEETWTNGCLGSPKGDEVCAMAIIPGWRVKVSDNLQTWFYRTDRIGKTIRLENPHYLFLPQPVASKLVQQMSQDTKIPSGKLRITEVKTKTYDGCLGIYRPNQLCTQVAFQGWQVLLASPDRTYVYHLSQNAERIAQNVAASGAKRKINVTVETFGEIVPLNDNEVFSSSIFGDLTGRMLRVVLTEDGKITRYQSSPTAKFAPVVIKKLSIDRLNAFKKTLASRQFSNLNGLSYLTNVVLGDYPTTTYQSQGAATQFIDLEKPSLPKSLQQSIASWDALIAPVK